MTNPEKLEPKSSQIPGARLLTDRANLDLRKMKIGALMNTSSGSCNADSEAELEAILTEAGLSETRRWCGGGDQVPNALTEAGAANLDLLIVVAGDGTIRAAAQSCGRNGPILAPLPGGTMNMLPKALYGAADWQTCLRATLRDPVTRGVHGGRVGDELFFVAAIFGAPTLFAEAREAARAGKILEAIERGLDVLSKAFERRLNYRFDDRAVGSAEAVTVLCPLTSRLLDDDAPTLEGAAIDTPGGLAAARLALTAAFANWRDDPDVTSAAIETATLSSSEPIPAILDGESFMLGREAKVTFVPNAFRALVPGER
jgi:diacylglycerol kinase family enzyme